MNVHKCTLRVDGKLRFTIRVEHAVGLEEMIPLVYYQMDIFCMDMPVSRKEVFDYCVETLRYSGRHEFDMEDDDLRDSIRKRIEHLFPDLIQ